jgi:hypothetical protein
MNTPSTEFLTQNLQTLLAHLTILREYAREADKPFFKAALTPAIEDAQEAIARVSSRLRQLGQPVNPTQLDESGEKLLRQARHQAALEEKLKFLHHWFKHQYEWYQSRVKDLKQDADTQALFVALAQQTRVRLERWEAMLKELKVSLD